MGLSAHGPGHGDWNLELRVQGLGTGKILWRGHMGTRSMVESQGQRQCSLSSVFNNLGLGAETLVNLVAVHGPVRRIHRRFVVLVGYQRVRAMVQEKANCLEASLVQPDPGFSV